MNDPLLQSNAIDAITALNAAVRNLRLYPPGSAMIQTSIDKVQTVVDRMLAHTATVTFAESEKKLLICDQPLGEKELQKPQLHAFLELMLDMGVRSLDLERGLDRRQLKALLLLLCRKPEEVEARGGLRRLADELELSHIRIDHKHYVALADGQRVVDGAQDDDPGPGPGGAPAEGQAADDGSPPLPDGPSGGGPHPDRTVRIANVRSSVEQILRGDLAPFRDREVIQPLAGTVGQLAARGKEQTLDSLLDQVGRALQDEEPGIRENGARVLARILDRLPGERRARIVHRLLSPVVALAERDDTPAPVLESIFGQVESVIRTHLDEGQPAALERVRMALGRLAESPSAAPAIRETARRLTARVGDESPPSDGAAPPPAPDADLAAGEAEVDRLSAAGDTAAAAERLLSLVRAAAKAKRFEEAERLRDRIYEVDALALSQIIAAGEAIEAAKGDAIDSDHLQVFAEFYASLNATERNGLYHAMQPANAAGDQALVRQGETNDRLFFLNAGEVKVVYRRERGEMLLDRVDAGALVGAESFFKATVATVSAVSLGPVQAMVLKRGALERLERELPGLEAKLRDFALGLDRTAELLRQKGMDRRTQRRFKVEGRVRVQLLDRNDRASGRPFTGQLADFSVGGISFFIKSARRETARLLLGRRLALRFSLAGNELAPLGTVIGVNYLLETDYSIHVRFDRTLDPALAEALEGETPQSDG